VRLRVLLEAHHGATYEQILAMARTAEEDPVHPYTDALLAAVPTVSGDIVDPSLRARGEIGDSAHPPAGCRYHPRCPLAIDICAVQEPAMMTVRGRLAACHRAEETGSVEGARSAPSGAPCHLPREGGGT
jgi:oligopeptide/dipeptide ABC transporter ATP-binding protein